MSYSKQDIERRMEGALASLASEFSGLRTGRASVNLLDSINLLGNVSRLLADASIAGLQVRHAHVREALDRNPILVTALNPVIGYEQAAAIAKQAYREGRPVLEVAIERSGLSEKQLRKLLDPAALARGGIHGAPGGGGG